MPSYLLPPPSAPCLSAHRYTIKVYTSDIRYAGTDANVHIVMHGEKPTGEKCKSPALTLANR